MPSAPKSDIPVIPVTKLRGELRATNYEAALDQLSKAGVEGLLILKDFGSVAGAKFAVAFGPAFRRTLVEVVETECVRGLKATGVVLKETAAAEIAAAACEDIAAILKRGQDPTSSLREIQKVINDAREHYRALIAT